MTVSSAHGMSLIILVGRLRCKEIVIQRYMFTVGRGQLREYVLKIFQSAIDLHLAQRRCYARMDHSHIATHDPTAIQGHQRIWITVDDLTAEKDKEEEVFETRLDLPLNLIYIISKSALPTRQIMRKRSSYAFLQHCPTIYHLVSSTRTSKRKQQSAL